MRAVTNSHSGIFPVYRAPDWVPLQRALAAAFGITAPNATAAFWFVGYVPGPADVGELRLYEHSTTRRQVALDREGAAYAWSEAFGQYVRADDVSPLIAALV